MKEQVQIMQSTLPSQFSGVQNLEGTVRKMYVHACCWQGRLQYCEGEPSMRLLQSEI